MSCNCNEHNHEHEHNHKHHAIDDVGCSCHKHSHEDENESKKQIIKIVVSALLFGVSFFVPIAWLKTVILVVSYLIVGAEVIIRAVKNIFKGEIFDENFLMVVATIGAFAIAEYPEAAAVMLFYQIGEFFQDLAVDKSKKNISALMDIRPDSANLSLNNDIKIVKPSELKIGDIIIIKAGEKVPVDCEIISGKTSLNTVALTGESLPRDVTEGDCILSGSINLSSTISAEVTTLYGESTVSKIIELMENSSAKKSKAENFITKFAKYYTPIVVLLAALIAIVPSLFDGLWSQWIYRGLSFLVVSCPCALVISVPLSFFAGIGGASKAGILVKGSNYMETLSKTDTIVFDKTGTLTEGSFEITEIFANINSDELIKIAAHIECDSSHPISMSIKRKYGKSLDLSTVSEITELAGMGVKGRLNNEIYFVGNEKLMNKNNINFQKPNTLGTVVYVSNDSEFLGYFVVSDVIKDDTKSALKALKEIGIKKTVMLTGDNKAVAESVGKELSIDEIYSELLPADKVEKVEKILSDEHKTAFVGDGINDAPVLALSDIGIAMGGVGSDAAIQAADMVIMNDKISKIVTAIRISKNTLKIVKENIIIALTIKFIVLALIAFGFGTMWLAVFADVGVTLIAIFNALRALRVKE